MRLELDPDADRRLLSPCYKVLEPASTEALIDAYDQAPAGHRHLLTLDDLGQALYTSMHASMHHDLDGGPWLLEAGIDPSWLEDDEYLRDDLPIEQHFQVRRLSIERQLAEVGFDDLFDKNLSLNAETRAQLAAANTDLLPLLDREVYLLRVPVQRACQALYAFPNGYFASDLSPLESVRLAEHLEDHYGYALFGLGASLIAFRKTRTLSEPESAGLLDMLVRLYAALGDEAITRTLFARVIEQQPLLVLRYTE